ncbi:cytochrome P450 [Catenulispora sp. MAP12-49]|uniref:cytochrome P450 n=1 Tax=unclassified Catenulispora TaxID=414885 RepID=UPI00351179A8
MNPHDIRLLGPMPDMLRTAPEPIAPIVTPAGDRMWLVRDYALARLVLSDRRFSRSRAVAPQAPKFLDTQPVPESVMSMDGSDHARLRRVTARAFSAQRIAALTPLVENLVDEQLALMAAAGPPLDFAAGPATHLPIAVMCGLLGVPADDIDRFRDCVSVLFDIEATPEDGARRRLELARYMTRLLAGKRRRPGEDLLSVLIAEHERGGLTRSELHTMGLTLLMAGFESTIGQITLAVLALLNDPETARILRDKPESVPTVVEELLRLNSASVVTFPRVAVEPVPVGGVTVQAGEAVVVSMLDGNRDAAVFPEPDRLALDGRDPVHLAFGHGTHRCLGAPLARLQLQVVLTRLFARFPTLRLADTPDPVVWKDGLATRGLVRLMVDWEPGDGHR